MKDLILSEGELPKRDEVEIRAAFPHLSPSRPKSTALLSSFPSNYAYLRAYPPAFRIQDEFSNDEHAQNSISLCAIKGRAFVVPLSTLTTKYRTACICPIETSFSILALK